uniref:Uncharacterized protein n=1 Tax=Bactrocera latifrons TaxID=174628 RepID=A0A0K8VLF7_BACLA
MSTLQFEVVNNDGSNTGHNDGIDGPLSRLLLRQNKALMRMARNRAWRMAIMNQTPFEKELPKALKEVISKLGAELRKRKAVRHGQIKSEMEVSKQVVILEKVRKTRRQRLRRLNPKVSTMRISHNNNSGEIEKDISKEKTQFLPSIRQLIKLMTELEKRFTKILVDLCI